MVLDYMVDYFPENERVRLEPLTSEHESQLKEAAQSHEIWTFFDEGGTTDEEFRAYLERAVQHRLKGREYPFVIFDKIKKRYAGMTRLYAYDPVLKNSKVGHTWIGKEFQNTGLNKACKHCILKFAFETLWIERVGFGVHEENVQSQRALARIGIQKEGELKSFFYKIDSSDRCNLLLYGITKEEWKMTIKDRLLDQYRNYL